MKINLRRIDIVIRGTVAAIIALLYLANIISGTTTLILGSIVLVLFITSVISFCPMYSIFGLNSSRKKKVERNFSLSKKQSTKT
ncbi:DUF2892 domain-containing protein [Flavobacterium sp. ACAM 123]|jgi:hypothetical protein|uniref:YgaP family membrane protein n=1 Tax=Flavobacterium sp. ACAM 123 TaxID=1189620 RepID=UPI000A0382A6|nr:DUF2892 domain-containing protein [Flavobacterium sp. ACAM 123]